MDPQQKTKQLANKVIDKAAVYGNNTSKDNESTKNNKIYMDQSVRQKLFENLQYTYKQDRTAVINDNIYTVGNFSSFAVSQQKRYESQQKFIDKTFRQAIYSHLQSVREMNEIDQQLKTRSQNLMKHLKGFFRFSGEADWSKIYELNKFLSNPVDQTINQIINDYTYKNYELVIRGFVQKILVCHQLAIVQGKLAQIKTLKTDQSIINQKNQIFIPTDTKNLYIKISNQNIPFAVFYNGLTFKTKQEMSQLNPQQRARIIDMVIKYLKTQNIILTQQDAQKKIGNLILSAMKGLINP